MRTGRSGRGEGDVADDAGDAVAAAVLEVAVAVAAALVVVADEESDLTTAAVPAEGDPCTSPIPIPTSSGR